MWWMQECIKETSMVGSPFLIEALLAVGHESSWKCIDFVGFVGLVRDYMAGIRIVIFQEGKAGIWVAGK